MTDDKSMSTFQPLWTVADVAKYLQLSTQSVYKKTEAGLIPCVRLAGSLRFDPHAIREWAVGGSRSNSVPFRKVRA